MKKLMLVTLMLAAASSAFAVENPLAKNSEAAAPAPAKSPYQFNIGVTTHREVYEEFSNGIRGMRETAVMNSLHAGVQRAIGESGGRVELNGELGLGSGDYTGSYMDGNYGDLHFSGLHRQLASVEALYKFSAPAWKGFTVGAGAGYRHHVDNLQDAGSAGYKRINDRSYLLLGVEQRIQLENWTITPALQYKHIVSSKQKSDLAGGVSVEQPDGYGAELAVSFIRKSDGYSVEYTPFVRTWDMQDSKIDAGTRLYEPRNKTREIGLTVAFHF